MQTYFYSTISLRLIVYWVLGVCRVIHVFNIESKCCKYTPHIVFRRDVSAAQMVYLQPIERTSSFFMW